MTQNDLHRAVARATGETVSTIKHLGFLLDDPTSRLTDLDSDDLASQVVDWDDLDAQRSLPSPGRTQREPAMA